MKRVCLHSYIHTIAPSGTHNFSKWFINWKSRDQTKDAVIRLKNIPFGAKYSSDDKSMNTALFGKMITWKHKPWTHELKVIKLYDLMTKNERKKRFSIKWPHDHKIVSFWNISLKEGKYILEWLCQKWACSICFGTSQLFEEKWSNFPITTVSSC